MAVNQFTWDIKTPSGAFIDRLRDIAYISNAILDRYCAVEEGPSIITSSDGDTWVEQAYGYIGSLRMADSVMLPKIIFDYYHGTNIEEG